MASITEALLTWAHEYPLQPNGIACVRAIANEIDATHEDELGAARAKVEAEYDGWYPPFEVEQAKEDRERMFRDCVEKNEEIARLLGESKGMRGFAERLEAAASERADVTLFGVDYVALPPDADGEPIHPGETLCLADNPDVCFADANLFLAANGYWAIAGRRPDELCHSHTPTVEDCILDLLRRLGAIEEATPEVGDSVSDCADAIRLLLEEREPWSREPGQAGAHDLVAVAQPSHQA